MSELLLDTTYLLPIFGIDVSLKDYSKFPRVLDIYRVLYNPVSLVEAKWISLRLMKGHPERRNKLAWAFIYGLKALLSEERISQVELTDPDVERASDSLLDAGVRDYFDRMIYATASVRGYRLLTEDDELLKLNVDFRPKEVLSWSSLLRQL